MRLLLMTLHLSLIATSVIGASSDAVDSETRELTVDDFNFEGLLGSEGATIERIGTNHFKVTLASAPGHPTWANNLQFIIEQNAKGNSLRLDVVFLTGDDYRFNEYFHSWSYDRENWNPVQWEHQTRDSKKGDTLLFPRFNEDKVFVGLQVPMSFEKVVELVSEWEKNPSVTVHILGKSLGGRNLYRLEITDPDSEVPKNDRWVHYFANQHPGEHNAQWRMVGMIDWLLTEEGADCRKRSISHFVLMMSPDAPSKGWYRVSAQGVDQNRSYLAEGSDPEKQPHEAHICQKDLEDLMASEAPITDAWSMHTWGGVVEPIAHLGPEVANKVGPWTEFRDLIEKNDPKDLVEPLAVRDPGTPTYWSAGTFLQFGITSVLCEGAGAIDTKEDNIESGKVLMKSICEYYHDTKSTASYRNSKVLDCFLNVADEMKPQLPWMAKTEHEHWVWQKEFKAKVIELLEGGCRRRFRWRLNGPRSWKRISLPDTKSTSVLRSTTGCPPTTLCQRTSRKSARPSSASMAIAESFPTSGRGTRRSWRRAKTIPSTMLCISRNTGMSPSHRFCADGMRPAPTRIPAPSTVAAG